MLGIGNSKSFLAIVRPDGVDKFSFPFDDELLCLDPSSNKSMVLEFISVGEGRSSDAKPYKLRFWGYYVDKETTVTPPAESVSVTSPSVAEPAPVHDLTAPRSRLQEDSGRKWLNVEDEFGNVVQASYPAIFYLTSAAGPDKSVSSGTVESAGSHVWMLEVYNGSRLDKVCIGGTASIKGGASGTYKIVSARPEPTPSLGLHIQVIAAYNEDGTINSFS